jgi:hypothetical protein
LSTISYLEFTLKYSSKIKSEEADEREVAEPW